MSAPTFNKRMNESYETIYGAVTNVFDWVLDIYKELLLSCFPLFCEYHIVKLLLYL